MSTIGGEFTMVMLRKPGSCVAGKLSSDSAMWKDVEKSVEGSIGVEVKCEVK